MKEKELRDIFHAYRPEIDDNDAFMDRLTALMDAEDAQQKQVRIIPLYRRVLPWIATMPQRVQTLLPTKTLSTR